MRAMHVCTLIAYMAHVGVGFITQVSGNMTGLCFLGPGGHISAGLPASATSIHGGGEEDEDNSDGEITSVVDGRTMCVWIWKR